MKDNGFLAPGGDPHSAHIHREPLSPSPDDDPTTNGLVVLGILMGMAGGTTVLAGIVIYVPSPVWITGFILIGGGSLLSCAAAIRTARHGGAGFWASLGQGFARIFRFLLAVIP